MAEEQKRGYLLENFRLFHLHSPGGTTTELHYHEFCKVLLLLSGSGSYYVDGRRYRLCAGDIVLINSRSLHRPELDASTTYERIIIYISPEYLRRASAQGCDLLAVFTGGKGPVLRLNQERRRRLFALAYALEKDLETEAFGREILGNCGMLRLMVELGRCSQAAQVLEPSPLAQKNSRIRDILQYLDDNVTEELDADKIAQKFFISKFHMMRLFRQETGITLHQYVTQKRLLMARGLMDSGMHATEACYQSGFKSYSSFTRASLKQLGTTPTGRPGSVPEGREGEE